MTTAGHLTITATIRSELTTDTTITLGVDAADPYGGPVDVVSAQPVANIVDQHNGLWLVTLQPTPLSYVFRAFKDGYDDVRTSPVAVPAKATAARPSLAITSSAAASSSTWQIVFTFVGTGAQYSMNGGGLVPTTSPLVVSRASPGSAPDIYLLIVTGADGSTFSSDPITVQAEIAPVTVPTDPSGGATVDTEARASCVQANAAIAAIKAALAANGIPT